VGGVQVHTFWGIYGDVDPEVYGGGVQVHTYGQNGLPCLVALGHEEV